MQQYIENHILPNTFVDMLPCIYILKDRQFNYLNFNSAALKAAQLKNRNDIIGKTDHEMPWKEFADRYQDQDKKVLKGEEVYNIDPTIRADGSRILLFTKKAPLYSEIGKIIGITGLSFELTPDKSTNFFSFFASNNLSFTNFSFKASDRNDKFNYGNVVFSKRQAQVISYLLRGHSAASTSHALKLSKRTVETHIENIKNILGCQTKVELINCAFEFGFIDLMFLK